jgi:hypothetical protein
MQTTKKDDALLDACVAAFGAFIEQDNVQTRRALAEARQRFRDTASVDLGVPSSAACGNERSAGCCVMRPTTVSLKTKRAPTLLDAPVECRCCVVCALISSKARQSLAVQDSVNQKHGTQHVGPDARLCGASGPARCARNGARPAWLLSQPCIAGVRRGRPCHRQDLGRSHGQAVLRLS